MDSLMRGRVTEYLKAQAEMLQLLEGILEDVQADDARNEIVKIQHEQVNLQTRFTRLMYLSAEI